jgi:hypothetical protein
MPSVGARTQSDLDRSRKQTDFLSGGASPLAQASQKTPLWQRMLVATGARDGAPAARCHDRIARGFQSRWWKFISSWKFCGQTSSRFASDATSELPLRSLPGLVQVFSQPIFAAVIFSVMGMASGLVYAYELDLGVGVGVGYTNNVDRSEDKESDVPLEVFTDFRYMDRSPRTEGLIEGRVAQPKSLQGNASYGLRPNVHGNLLWHLDPDRWTWTLDGVWELKRKNQVDTDAPENLETQAVVWTGPEFRVPLSSVTSLQTELRAGYEYKSDTTDDNYNFDGALRIETKTSETAALSANLEGRAVRYRDTNSDTDQSVADFNIAETFFGYTRRDGRIDTLIDAGGSFAQVKGAGNRSRPFLRVDTSRDLSSLSRGGLRLFYGFDNEANAVLVDSLVPEIERETNAAVAGQGQIDAAVAGLFYEKRADFYYERSGKRSNLAGTLYARHRDYENDLNDERVFGGEVQWTRSLTRLTEGRVLGTVGLTKFNNLSIDDRDYGLRVRILRKLSRQLTGEVQLGHWRRKSNESSRNFDETSAFFSLTYDLPI